MKGCLLTVLGAALIVVAVEGQQLVYALRPPAISGRASTEMLSTPFAFLINEKGVIASKGIINNRQHIRYVLSGSPVNESNGQTESEDRIAERAESVISPSNSLPNKEVDHV